MGTPIMAQAQVMSYPSGPSRAAPGGGFGVNFGGCFTQPQDRMPNISEKDLQQMRAVWTQRMDEEFGVGEDHGGGAAHWAAFAGNMRVLADIVRDKARYP